MPDPAASTTDQIRQLLLEKYEPIAIVGVGLRFPGGNGTLDGFADFLAAGGSGIVPIPSQRWDVEALAGDGDRHGRVRTTGGGFVDGLDQFDPKFFNISPKEAQYVDPQQRLILEAAWEALENANIDPTALRHGDGGVFMGIGSMDYLLELEALKREELTGHLGTGTAHSAASGRLSYFLGWRGPCLSVDTACSSSLVAVHLAAQALRRGECGIALAGGVNAIHHPTTSIVFSEAEMLAPDGRCKTFDDCADGYSRSEGCGVLVLKRLSVARRDGDRILALIRGSAVRQDGESAGLTVPNGTAQEAVMRAALASAALDPADIGYVEAHGTGTPLGDPIEMGSINDVFADSRDPAEPMVVGSVKTNLGHLEIAAGVAGIVKTVLQLRHRTIYPHINFDTPSGRIPWDRYPVLVPTSCRPWRGGPRRAIVNSFGFTGTIATVVLEQAPPTGAGATTSDGPGGHVFALSAKTRNALRGQLERYRKYLADRPELPIAEVCRTSTLGRAHFGVRVAGVVHDREELADFLDRRVAALDGTPSGTRDIRKVAFLFTGQGAQYAGMGAALYRQHAVFREHLDECDRLFEPYLGRSLRALVLGEVDEPEQINQTGYGQPALFAVEYAAARLWMSWGVRPTALIGHSIGEIAAAAVAGLFRLEDAVRLVAARARVMQSVTVPGGMVAVQGDAELVGPLLERWPDLSVAAINAPGRCVISGRRAQLDAFVTELRERGLPTKELRVSHAFHSPLMADVAEEFRAALDGITFGEPTLTLVSTLTGQVARPAEIGTVDYWVRHLREPVDFAAGMRTVERRGRHAFIEVGPAPTLTVLGKLCTTAEQHLWLSTTSSADTDGDAVRVAVARLYAAGLAVSWTGYHAGRPGAMTELPTYAFDRRRYWLPTADRPGTTEAAPAGPVHHPLLGAEVSTAQERAAGVRVFVAEVAAGRPAYLADHRAMGELVFPLAGYLETLFALQAAVYGETSRSIDDLTVHEPLLLTGDEPVRLRTRLCTRPDGGADVELTSSGRAASHRHVTAGIRPPGAGPAPLAGLAADLAGGAAALDGTGTVLPAEQLYAIFGDLGVAYGPRFRRIERVTHGADLAVGELTATDTAPLEHLPPPLLDGALQTVAALAGGADAHLPVRIGSCQLFKKPMAGSLRGVLRLTPVEPDGVADAGAAADAVLLEGDRLVFALRGLGYRRVGAVREAHRRLLHEPRWVRRSLRGGDRAGTGRTDRHLLAVHGSPELLAGLAGGGVRVTRATTTTEVATVLAQRPTDVCWFWRPEPGPPGFERLRAECERNHRDLLELLRMLAAAGAGRQHRLWLVTEGAQPLPGDPSGGDGDALAAATLWGVGRVLGNEYPTYRTTLVDLNPGLPDYRTLLDEVLAAEPDELQVAYRDSGRYVRRLHPVGAADGNVELAVSERGGLAGIRSQPAPVVPPTGDEIQVRVGAAGLNYKDVANAAGVLREHATRTGVPYQPEPLGFEAAGTVSRAGPDARFAVGDAVLVSHPGALRRTLTVPSAAAVAMPANLDVETAAGQATAYLNACHAVYDLAAVRAGDRVLVHSAAGGIGQAAAQLALRAGAEVYATASPAKWPFLRSRGVDRLIPRTPDFADEVLRRTGGAGVDVVIGGLNGEYIPAGLRALAPGGRFVQLGKIDVWTPEQVREQRPDVTYHAFYLSELPDGELRELVARLLPTVAELLAVGAVPPIPTTAYAPEEAEEAFEVLSRGANTGKLVISFPDDPAPAGLTVSPDETYLITGGLGGLGRAVAHRLVALGARHLTIVGRRPVTGTPPHDLGVEVEVDLVTADIGDPADVTRLTERLLRGPRPLGGIVHAAGVLADAPLPAQTWESFDRVFQAKVYGSWLLDRAARRFPGLRFFVGYSSIAALFGPPGQANYAAGNAFLDALLCRRAGAGEPGLTVNWGPWAEVGMAAGLGAAAARGIEARGVRMLDTSSALDGLWRALASPAAQVLVGEFDWGAVTAAAALPDALYRAVAPAGAGPAQRLDLAALLAQPPARRIEAVDAHIRASIAGVLQFDGADDVESETEFVALGLDSLAAVALRNSLEASFQVSLPASIIFDYPSVRLLARYLDRQLVPAVERTAPEESS